MQSSLSPDQTRLEGRCPSRTISVDNRNDRHAAGLNVSGFETETAMHMAKYTRDLYEKLAEETGQETGFKLIGYLQPATNPNRLDSLRRRADFARGYGVSIEEISAAEVKNMWPLFETADIRRLIVRHYPQIIQSLI